MAASSFGVVTIAAPEIGTVCTALKTASPVPGGRSRTIASSAPQSTSPANCFMAPVTIGPRHSSGWESSTSIPIEIAFMPSISGGTIFRLAFTVGKTFLPNKTVALGPWMSQSISPTLASPPAENLRAKARARFTATVLLPTPPFPEATATVNFTPASPSGTPSARAETFFDGSSESSFTSNSTPGNFSARAREASSRTFFAESSEPPVKILTSARPSPALAYFTIPKDTMSLEYGGYFTPRRASKMSSLVISMIVKV